MIGFDWGSVAIGQNVPVGDVVIGEPPLLTIHPDGTVEGRLEDMGEAARLFVETVRVHLDDLCARAWDEGCAAEYAAYTSEGPRNPYRR